MIRSSLLSYTAKFLSEVGLHYYYFNIIIIIQVIVLMILQLLFSLSASVDRPTLIEW